jgi:D-sedoheptulose 7-phosphate isomerase
VNDGGQTRAWLDEVADVVRAMDPHPIDLAIGALRKVTDLGGTIYVAGNGGSALGASHLALDLQKAARRDGRGVRCVALSDNVGLITAWANDTSFERVFVEQIDVLAEPNDALVVWSVSGSSPNIVAALELARSRSLVTVAFVGARRGPAAQIADHCVVVPSQDYGWVESGHVILGHILTYALRGSRASARGKDS